MRIRNLQITLLCMVCIACSQPKIEQRYIPLDLGQVKAEGWLKDWAQDAANGITGHLDEYEKVFEYGWLGRDIAARQSDGDGVISSTGWLLEQSAYWIDGSLKTGAILGDSTLFCKAARRLDGVVDGVLASKYVHTLETGLDRCSRKRKHRERFLQQLGPWPDGALPGFVLAGHPR